MPDSKTHEITFQRSGRGKAQCPPNPDYPNGIALDAFTADAPSCTVSLPYPAPECGMWIVYCRQCSMSMAITAAGRPDDPISVKMNCQGIESNLGMPESSSPNTEADG